MVLKLVLQEHKLNNMNNTIIKIISQSNSRSFSGHGAGWVNLCHIGSELHKSDCEYSGNLLAYIKTNPDFEVYMDSSKPIPVAYVRSRRSANVDESHSILNKRRSEYQRLTDWAYLGDLNRFLDSLASLASKDEVWSYANNRPKYPRHPILWSYLSYTFCRLQRQDKICYSINGNYAAFDTGLYDDRIMPIIALFSKNSPERKSDWIFKSFVFYGEGEGKILVREFEGKPERATYYEKPEELHYDLSWGSPVLDYDHIIVRRADRFPAALLQKYISDDFEIKDISTLSAKEEYSAYISSLKEHIRNNTDAFNMLKNSIDNAVSLALKRVSYNPGTAVPMFYPKDNCMCLLIPLCLQDNKHEDVALVVKRTNARKYEGATILTLDMAYADARVIARPSRDWLENTRISSCE